MLKIGKPERASIFVLAGDLAGYSTSHATGYGPVIEQFLTRYYQVVDMVVTAAGGQVVKYLGDGFFAVWEVPKEEAERARLCALISEAALTLSYMVNYGQLNMRMRQPLRLRQGISVEENALKLTYRCHDRTMARHRRQLLILIVYRVHIQ